MQTHLNTPSTTRLNLPVLHHIWEKHILKAQGKKLNPTTNVDWKEEVNLMNNLGIGLDETLHFLLFNQPSYSDFENWVIQKNHGHIAEEKLNQLRRGIYTSEIISLEEDVLNADDLNFWNDHGYLLLKQAISPEQTENTAKAIWEFLRADPGKPETWYQPHEAQRGLMYLFYQHPALQSNRQSPRIRKAYEQLYQSRDLNVSIDKISFNPPETNTSKFKGAPLHWDTSLIPPIPMDLQGLIYLTDTGPESGAFQCVPGFHRKIDEWLMSLPATANPREIALNELKPIAVPGKAGDLIIWHQALPHGASPNKGSTPRLVQYLTWHLTNRKIHSEWR